MTLFISRKIMGILNNEDFFFRLISYYYFLRYGDDYRKNKIRSRMGDKHTFDECVANGLPDCEPKKLWQQVRGQKFFSIYLHFFYTLLNKCNNNLISCRFHGFVAITKNVGQILEIVGH